MRYCLPLCVLSLCPVANAAPYRNLHESFADTKAILSAGGQADGVHFDARGGEFVGDMMYNLFRYGVVPEPSIISALALPTILLMRRRRDQHSA